MKKRIHLYYDERLDEFVMAGIDGRPIAHYTGDRPDDLIKLLIAETVIQNEADQEITLGMKGD